MEPQLKLVETRKGNCHRLSWQKDKCPTVYAQEDFSELLETFKSLGTWNGRWVSSTSGLPNPKNVTSSATFLLNWMSWKRLFIRTTAVTFTKLDAKPTKVSFSSLAVASDQNENHVFYFESTTMKRGSNCFFSEKNCSQVTMLHLPCLHRGSLK